MILRRATKSVSLIPENNTKKMCFYKFVATLLLSLTHRTAKILKTNILHQIKNILLDDFPSIFRNSHPAVFTVQIIRKEHFSLA